MSNVDKVREIAKGYGASTMVLDDILDTVYHKELYIDQLGRVVQQELVEGEKWGSTARCRKCVYFSPAGAMLPWADKHCKYNKYGPVNTDKVCARARWIEVKDEQESN